MEEDARQEQEGRRLLASDEDEMGSYLLQREQEEMESRHKEEEEVSSHAVEEAGLQGELLAR